MLKCYSYDIVCQEIPDEVTLALNISNCPIHCKGCHSPWLWEDKGEEVTDSFLTDLVRTYVPAITCVCFMGGDGEPEEVGRLARLLHQQFLDVKVAWYSGKQSLPQNFRADWLDYLKLGPYIEQLGGLASPATNQRLYRIEDGTLVPITLLKKKPL